MSFGEKILAYRNEILKTLSDVVAIRSVSAEGSEVKSLCRHLNICWSLERVWALR